MSITAAALRELHRIHQQLAELRDRLERGPRQVRAREGSVAQLEARLAEARDRPKSPRAIFAGNKALLMLDRWAALIAANGGDRQWRGEGLLLFRIGLFGR